MRTLRMLLGQTAVVILLGCGSEMGAVDGDQLDAAVDPGARNPDAAAGADREAPDSDSSLDVASDPGLDSGVPNRNVVDVKWTADTLVPEIPSGRECGLQNAVLDTTEFSEGTASMRVESPVGDIQGSMGCQDFGQTDLSVEWNGGQWLCMYFDMRIDSGFNWDRNQRKFKMQRMVNTGSWTMYLNEDGVDISECPTCTGCTGGDRCTVAQYDMRPPGAGGANPVDTWQSYTIGIQMESGAGNADGSMKLWVDGVLVDEVQDQVYCESCSGTMRGAWGTFGVSPYPQSPDGTLWLDDFVLASGPDECAPRP